MNIITFVGDYSTDILYKYLGGNSEAREIQCNQYIRLDYQKTGIVGQTDQIVESRNSYKKIIALSRCSFGTLNSII